jgi:chromosome segregation ATPase
MYAQVTVLLVMMAVLLSGAGVALVIAAGRRVRRLDAGLEEARRMLLELAREARPPAALPPPESLTCAPPVAELLAETQGLLAQAIREAVGGAREDLARLERLASSIDEKLAHLARLEGQIVQLRQQIVAWSDDRAAGPEQVNQAAARLAAAMEAAARTQIQALGDASNQVTRTFTGVARHLDATWEKVEETLAGVQQTFAELSRAREGIDRAIVRIASYEQRGREGEQPMKELQEALVELQEEAAGQAKVITKLLTLTRADQASLSLAVDRVRKLIEQRIAPPKR